MFGHDLVAYASIMDLQCWSDLARVMDREEKVQIQGCIQRTMEVYVRARHHRKTAVIVWDEFRQI